MQEATYSMSFQVGGQVGAYQIQEKLGSGGMATVYRADQPRLGRSVAIKVMHPNIASEVGFIARFEREARIVAKLDHPNIVPVYDYAEYENQPYLVMKYIEGQTLKEVIQQNVPTLAQTAVILRPIANALTYAHAQGILHRDIKPSNILLDERGTPYITDFGLARIAQSGASTMSADVMLGTPHYISPEQAQGQTDIDARTDVYSLGVVLYEMVTGRTPFVGDTSYAIIHDQIYTPPPPARQIKPDVPEAVEVVLSRALMKAREDRYETPDALLNDYLRAIGEGKPEAPSRFVKSNDATPQVNALQVNAPQPKPTVPKVPPSPMPPMFGPMREARQALKDARHEFRDGLSEARRSVKQGLHQAEEDVKRALTSTDRHDYTMWRPGTKWQIGPEGNLGFYTQEEMEQMRNESERGLTEEEKIRKRIEKRIEERNSFFIHFGIYGAVNLFLFMIWLTAAISSGEWFPWFLFPAGGWGIGVFAHWMSYYTEYGAGREKRQSRIDEEVARELERRGLAEKSKRKNEEYDSGRGEVRGEVRLTEDGEITDSFVRRYFDEDEEYQQR